MNVGVVVLDFNKSANDEELLKMKCVIYFQIFRYFHFVIIILFVRLLVPILYFNMFRYRLPVGSGSALKL